MNRIGFLLALCAALALVSCGRKNPVASKPTPSCEHFDADGLVLERLGAMLASQWQAAVVGGIALDEGTALDSVAVIFLTPDSVRAAVPSTCPFELRWEAADTNVVRVLAGAAGPWSVRIVGKVAGSTTLRLRIWHVDHSDFTSQPLPITVTAAIPHTPAGAAGALLFRGADLAASHSLNISGAYGRLPVALPGNGLTLGVRFLDGADQPIASLETGHALDWNVANASVATAEAVAGEPWALRLVPVAPGVTTLTVALRWHGGAEYTSAAFDVVVYDTLAVPTVPMSFLLKKSGLRHVFVRDGAQVPQCCSSVSTGFLPAVADTIEDLFNFRLLAYNDCALPPSQRCAETTPSASQDFVAFEFADAAMCGVVRHPEHVGEYHDFHLRGHAVGETTVRLLYLTGTTVEFRSPPLRVVVTASQPFAGVAGSGE